TNRPSFTSRRRHERTCSADWPHASATGINSSATMVPFSCAMPSTSTRVGRTVVAGTVVLATTVSLPGRLHLVQAALRLVAAGPAARARVLAVGNRLGARHAPDRRVAAPRQRVDRHVVVGDVAGDVLVGPRGERVHLHQATQVASDDRRVLP